jgi:hypothetical protein
MQGEFAAKKYYEFVLGDYMHRARPAWSLVRGHELLILLAAHASKRMDGSTGAEPADQPCLGKICQCGGNREIPRLRPTALDIAQAQAPPHLPLRISEILPATALRAARGRADAAEAAGCTVVATTNLAPLSSKIPPPLPPHFLSNNMSLREENQAVANHADFVSGRFLAEKTHLVGHWKLRILRKDEVRNR